MNWREIISTQVNEEYYISLKKFIEIDRESNVVYPPQDLVFNAFKLTLFEDIKIVIIGQDPYHVQNQANGLCFSVSNEVKTPPSLVNIFKEIKSDLNIDCDNNSLESWAKQGVFLLNTILTVRKGQPASHQNKGWEIFTDYIINQISENKENVIFLLWGKFAQSKEYLIDKNKHHILKSTHPSPYSANNGFFGCKQFSKSNEILKSIGRSEIVWST